MYHPGKTQTNPALASMARTFYPKHVSYFGNGTGRDIQVILNTGGLNKVDKPKMGHTGVHQRQYNRPNPQARSTTPRKEATTFYYQSDGSGRDSYVLKHNGGLRHEYSNKVYGDRIFRETLRGD
jgi:hypothetical protein